jgi:SAM-dependent methyltransferase
LTDRPEVAVGTAGVSGVPPARPGTDRTRLRQAYADSSKFDDRRNLYGYVHPRVDVLGWALDHVGFPTGGRVLDVGCGPGYYLERLRSHELDLTGLDLSEGMLAGARTRAPASWIVADAERLPIRADAFDIALAMHMLYHVADAARGVAEIRRVLRPGGALLVSAPARDHLAETRALVAGVIGARLDRPSARFRLEDAAGILGAEFETVERDDLRGEVVLTEPGPMVRHIASGRDFYEPLLPAGMAWETVITRVDAVIRDEIDRVGTFRAQTHTGVLVGR